MTRMGNVAGYRQAFADAQAYREEWNKYRRELADYEKKQQDSSAKKKDEDDKPPSPPKRDLKSETLVGAMNGEILVHIHCYRADEMAIMIDLAKEFGFKIAAFHHAVEAYKVADLLAQQQHLRRRVGRLVGLQDGSLRWRDGEPRAHRHAQEQLRRRPLRFGGRYTTAQPGSRQGHDSRQSHGPRHLARARDDLAHAERGRRRSASTKSPARSKPARWATW